MNVRTLLFARPNRNDWEGRGQEEPQVPQETSRVHIDAVAFAISAVDVGMHWTLMLPATDCFISFMSRMILSICMYTLARTYRPKYYVVRLYSHMDDCVAANWQPERRNLRLCCGPGFNSHLWCGWSTDNISEYTYVFTLRTDGLRGKRTDGQLQRILSAGIVIKQLRPLMHGTA